MITKPEIPLSGAPGSRQSVMGSGVVEFGANGATSKVWTRYGDEAPNPWLNFPLPNVTYVVGANKTQLKNKIRLRHVFKTASDRSTTEAMDLSVRVFNSNSAGFGKRWLKHQCVPVGFPGGSFDRGHLIAAQFGAGMEAINLVTMPCSVNQAHKPETAERLKFSKIAELGERYRDKLQFLKGQMNYRGEFILPNYREFELVLVRLATQGRRQGLDVSLRVEPSTIKTVTDVLYAEIWIEDQRIPYVIDCDLR